MSIVQPGWAAGRRVLPFLSARSERSCAIAVINLGRAAAGSNRRGTSQHADEAGSVVRTGRGSCM
eukprot:scaffold346_cov387-Prasinococcus_capsulatus_cf.AAC.6